MFIVACPYRTSTETVLCLLLVLESALGSYEHHTTVYFVSIVSSISILWCGVLTLVFSVDF